MAIDDNTSYELTGYQVKDLASKIRGKVDSSSLASVATSGLYSDLTGTPTIPTVNNGTLTIQQNGTTLGTFSANQDTNETINITGGGSGGVMVYVQYSSDTYSLYKDSGHTTAFAIKDIYAEATSGKPVVFYMSGGHGYSAYVTANTLDTVNRKYVTGGYNFEFVFHGAEKGYGDEKTVWKFYNPSPSDGSENTVSLNRLSLQPELYAGTGITIDTTYPDSPVISASGAATIFYYDDVTEDLYKDSYYTEQATFSDVTTAYSNGSVVIKDMTYETAYSSDGISVVAVDNIQSVFCMMQSSGAQYYVVYSYTPGGTPVWSHGVTELQNKLTAGTNVSILGNTISATDTTYSNFTGATSSVAGSAGLVPAPTTSDPDKFLKGDGTWATVASGETTTIFYWDAPNSAMYKDSGYVTAATMSDVETAASAGPVKIYSAGIGKYEYLVSDRIFAGGHFSTVWADNNGNLKSVAYTYPSDTWVRTSVNVQKQLTAGSNITIAGDGTISATDTTYSNFTGATSSVAGAAGLVPAPAAGDEAKALHGDGTWKDTTAKLVEMSYGESNAWAKFIAAYNAGSIVYCRASSNANPASGSQTRKAFMAYVNNAASPTSVEFQYVRSVSSKTEAQPVDQVFVYTLTNTNGGTWSVASRNMGPKIAAGAGISVSYSNGTYTIRLASTDGQGGASD